MELLTYPGRCASPNGPGTVTWSSPGTGTSTTLLGPSVGADNAMAYPTNAS
ncbi:MAG: hypothetical protein ACLP7F_14065 [Acidimicrobiales bacterium]